MAGAGGNFRFRRTAGAILTILGAVALTVGVFTSSAGATLSGGAPYDGTDEVLDTHTSVSTASDGSGNTDDSYGGNAKENGLCPGVVTQSVPPNEDLVAFSVGYAPGTSDSFLYLAWRRAPQSSVGSATVTVDFELNKSATGCGNGVNVVRSNGDRLITYDFHGTGTPSVEVRTWSTSAGEWSAADVLDAGEAEASISDDDEFGELVVNLDAAGIFQTGACNNFAGVFAKGRASNAFNSDLKDYVARVGKPVGNCGVLTVSKVLAGDTSGFDTSQEFTIGVDCTDDAFDTTLSLAGGASDTLIDIPFDTSCTATETALPSAGTNASWSTSYSDSEAAPDGSGEQTVVIVDATGESVTVTNTRSVQTFGCVVNCSAPPEFGSLTITKTVVNGEGDESFDFGVDCGSGSQIVTLGDGDSLTVDDIPEGTTCTVVEQEPEGSESESWATTVTDSDGANDGVVVIDGAERVAFTNTRTVVLPAVVTTTTTAPPPPAPTVLPEVIVRELPRTGVETRDLLVMAGIAILLGGLLLLISDRTKPAELRP